jgi:hypothetical protein
MSRAAGTTEQNPYDLLSRMRGSSCLRHASHERNKQHRAAAAARPAAGVADGPVSAAASSSSSRSMVGVTSPRTERSDPRSLACTALEFCLASLISSSRFP